MIKPVIITVLLLFLMMPAFAQQQKAELLKLLDQSKPDTGRLKALCKLGAYYQTRRHEQNKNDLDSAKHFFEKELALSQSLHDDTSNYGQYETKCKLGEVCSAANNIAEGKAYFMEGINYYHAEGYLVKEAKAWNRLGHRVPNLDEKKSALKKALDLTLTRDKAGKIDTNRVIQMNYNLAVIDLMAVKFDLVRERCLQLIDKYQYTQCPSLDHIYFLLAIINRYQGNLDKSLFYVLKSIKWMEMTKDTIAADDFYGELAQIDQELGRTAESIYYYKKTIEIRERNFAAQQYIFRTAGFMIQGLIKEKKALEGLDYVISLEKRHPPDDKSGLATIAQIKAYCYEALKKYKSAEKFYLIMIKDYGVEQSEIAYLARYDIAKFYIKQKKYTEASGYLLKDYARSNPIITKDFEYLFFQVDSAAGKYLSAIDHFRQYKLLNDSIFNTTKSRQIEELQIKYNTEQKEKDIALLKRDSQIQQGKAQQANTVRNFTLAGTAVLILITGLLYHNYRIKQRNNIEMNNKNISLKQLVKDKEWLIKEIHHRVKNNLQIVMGLLQRQSSFIDNTEALTAFQNSGHRMQSIALIHQKLYQSENLALIDMPAYVDELVVYIKDCFDIGNRIEFQRELEDIQLDVSQAVPLGLILNEAITNSIKYAFPGNRSGRISIALSQTVKNDYLLAIADNGIGLAPGLNIEQNKSMGMNLIRGLSRQLSGSLVIENCNGLTLKIIFKPDEMLRPSLSKIGSN